MGFKDNIRPSIVKLQYSPFLNLGFNVPINSINNDVGWCIANKIVDRIPWIEEWPSLLFPVYKVILNK